MIKKIFILLILVTLTSCDYEPIYSKKNNTNELINKIELSGDKKINRAITSALNLKKSNKKRLVIKCCLFLYLPMNLLLFV